MMNKHSKVLALLLLSLIFSACAKKEISENDVNHESNIEAYSIDSSDVKQSDSDLDAISSLKQKPDVILNTQVSDVEETRRMVREASVHFTANDVIKTALSIDKMTVDAGGFVERKNIDFHILDIETQNIADGKIKVFEKVNPIAVITVRIPSEKAAAFVNQLLPLMSFLTQQQYSAKRYELRLLEEKIEQAQVVPSNTKNTQLNEISRLTQLEVQDRVQFSTINIYINQPLTIRETMDVDVDAVARLNADNFWKRAWNGVQYGWQFVLDALVALITIWPLYLIALISFIFYRLIKPWLKKIK